MWVYFCLPETKGATLEEMDRVFKSHSGEADAIMLAEARRDVGLNPEPETVNDKVALDNGRTSQSQKSHIEEV